MAVTITRELADQYFTAGNHVYWRVWDSLDEADRDALVTQAIRTISRAIGSDVAAETVTDDSLDFYRPDYAVYEQAIYSIPPHLIANGENTAPHWIGIGPDGEVTEFPKEGSISPEAKKWLDVQSGSTVTLARG